MKILVHIYIILIGIMLVSCQMRGDSTLKEKFISEVQISKATGKLFCFSTITTFDWQRVYLIDGESDGWQKEQVSAKICGEGFAIGAHEKYIIFLSGREIVNYFALDSREDPSIYVYSNFIDSLSDCPNNYASPETGCYQISGQKEEYGFGNGLILKQIDSLGNGPD